MKIDTLLSRIETDDLALCLLLYEEHTIEDADETFHRLWRHARLHLALLTIYFEEHFGFDDFYDLRTEDVVEEKRMIHVDYDAHPDKGWRQGFYDEDRKEVSLEMVKGSTVENVEPDRGCGILLYLSKIVKSEI